MTNQNNAAQPPLTDDQIEALAKKHIAPHADRLDAIMANPVPYQQTEQFRRVKALIVDVLSNLRAPVADERAAFEAWMASQNLGFLRDGDSYSLTYARRAWDAWQARAALARTAVASAEVMDALNWVDDFIARCNRDDRGSCESVNVLRRALASAPVAGEAQQESAALRQARHDSANAKTERERVLALAGWLDQQKFEPEMLSCAAATLRAMLSRDAALDELVRRVVNRAVSNCLMVGDVRAIVADLKAQSAALAAQPGAQRTGGSDAG